MCYLKERIPLKSENVVDMVNRERWYYTFGRAMGTFTWVGIIIAIVRSIAV